MVAHTVTNVLGVSQACCWEECCVSNVASGNNNTGGGGVGWDRSSGKDQPQPSPTPPTQRRLAKSFSVTPSAVTKGTFSAILSLADTQSVLLIIPFTKTRSHTYCNHCTLILYYILLSYCIKLLYLLHYVIMIVYRQTAGICAKKCLFYLKKLDFTYLHDETCFNFGPTLSFFSYFLSKYILI